MIEWWRNQLDRDSDISTPPWLTIRFWLACASLICAGIVLILVWP